MLHISISAAVYRPLAVHVQIPQKHRNVVQLHEASHGEITVQNQQATINKEPTDFHVKKLQSTCHHSVPYDPDDIVAKLQVITWRKKLRLVTEPQRSRELAYI